MERRFPVNNRKRTDKTLFISYIVLDKILYFCEMFHC